MSTSSLPLPEPFFLAGTAGRVFCLHLPAVGACKGGLLYLPPFAEEMNRCRATVAAQARALSRLGYACLLVDPLGTGDSDGDLADADWATWRADALAAADWLTERCGAPPILWGLRLGALLAADLANHAPDRFRRLLLWQPVADGRLFLTQYLRLRIASLMDRGLPAETTDGIRAALQAGESVEVAGYRLGGRLCADIDTVKIADMAGLSGHDIDWFELVAEAGQPMTPASRKLIDKLTAQGCAVTTRAFTGPPVWQLHKRDELPELLAATTARFAGTDTTSRETT